MADVVAIGETLVEFVSTEPAVTLREATAFEKTAGGTPPSVAMRLARLGVSSGVIGRVGDDPFGCFLADTLASGGVDVSQLGFEGNAQTGLAFISHTPEGGRDFLFFHHRSAHTLLSPGHISPGYVKNAQAIVFSSVSLTTEPCRSGVLKALAIAHDAGVVRVYDAHRPLSLSGSESEVQYLLHLGLDRANIVKLSLDDMEFLSGTRDLPTGMEWLWTRKSRQGDNMHLVIVTLGAQGCSYRTSTDSGQISSPSVESVEAIGAGDGFLAGLLAELLCTASASQGKLAAELPFERDSMERALRFANGASALTTSQRGAVPGLPTRSQVEAFLNDTQ